MPGAKLGHDSAKDLIAQVEGVESDGEMYDANVKVMGAFAAHYIKEERAQMFCKAKKSGLGLRALEAWRGGGA